MSDAPTFFTFLLVCTTFKQHKSVIFNFAYIFHSILKCDFRKDLIPLCPGDPFDENITEIVQEIVYNLTSDNYAYDTFMKINDSFTVNNASYYGADFFTEEDHGTTHLSVLAPNGDAVAVTSTINRS